MPTPLAADSAPDIEARQIDAWRRMTPAEKMAAVTALGRAARTHSTANAIHHATQLRIDLFVAGGTPLDAQQLARRMAVDVGGGRVLHIHPPEDILLQKLRWYRLGGDTSDRQWRDVLGIVRVQGARLDRTYLRENAAVLGVGDVLDRALGDG